MITEDLKKIKKVFPNSKIYTELEYHFEDEKLVITTPDRSEANETAVRKLQAIGLSGIWRINKRGEK